MTAAVAGALAWLAWLDQRASEALEDKAAHHAWAPARVAGAWSASPVTAHRGRETAPGFDWRALSEPTAAERAELQAALADHPDRAGELARLLAYTRFEKRAALWRTWREQDPEASRQARNELGAALLEDLPTHTARAELMGPQAWTMAQALVDDRGGDAAVRQAEKERHRQRLERAVAAPTGTGPSAEAGVDPQSPHARFLTRQEDIVAGWRALPPAERDPAWLADRLEAERRTLLGEQPPP